MEALESTEKERKKGHRTLNHFLSANVTAYEKKKDIFLKVIGLQTYKLLKSLVASTKPDEKDYGSVSTGCHFHSLSYLECLLKPGMHRQQASACLVT